MFRSALRHAVRLIPGLALAVAATLSLPAASAERTVGTTGAKATGVGTTRVVPRSPPGMDDAPVPKAAPRKGVEVVPAAPPALAQAFKGSAIRFDFACTAAEAAVIAPAVRPAMHRCPDPFLVIDQEP